MVKQMGPNKTSKAIIRASKAAAGMGFITEAFDKCSGINKKSRKHSHKSSDKDELLMLADLRKEKPFVLKPGRSHFSFPDIPRFVTCHLDREGLLAWLNHHKKQVSKGLLP